MLLSIIGIDKNLSAEDSQVLSSKKFVYCAPTKIGERDAINSVASISDDAQWTKFRLSLFTDSELELQAYYSDAQGVEHCKKMLWSGNLICKLDNGSFGKPVSKTYGYGITE